MQILTNCSPTSFIQILNNHYLPSLPMRLIFHLYNNNLIKIKPSSEELASIEETFLICLKHLHLSRMHSKEGCHKNNTSNWHRCYKILIFRSLIYQILPNHQVKTLNKNKKFLQTHLQISCSHLWYVCHASTADIL